MSADPFRSVEWAGVAVRMSDGTLYAFEMDGWIEGQVVIEHDMEDAGFDPHWQSYKPMPRPSISVELRGTGVMSARFADAAKHQAPQRAIADVPPAIDDGSTTDAV